MPTEAAKEDREQRAYFDSEGTPLLVDYLAAESAAGERVVVENDDWAAVVPYWAVWPFETLVLPRRICRSLADLVPAEREALADLLKRLLIRYDTSLRNELSLFNGLARTADKLRRPLPLATSRPLLPAAVALGHRQKVHGGLRNAGYPAT